MPNFPHRAALRAAPAFAFASALASAPALAADDAQIQQLRQEINAMRQDYEARLRSLENRLQQAEAAAAAKPAAADAGSAPSPATAQAAPSAAPAAAPEAVAAAPAAANAFNPAIALILSGTYSNLSQDPATYRFPGFLTGNQIGPAPQGFSLGETELNISANIDPWFYGALNLAIDADNSVSVEEAYVQTTALPDGLVLRAGRYLSGIGYLNSKHAHTWDFADAPLVYQAFLDGQLKEDGLQLRVLLPTAQFIELGGELGAAGPFPSGNGNGNQPGTATLFAHTGGDVGTGGSWRAGLSYLWAKANDRESGDIDRAGNDITNAFDGTSHLVILDGIWKWAPNGNPQRTNLTLQGEYVWRRESGRLTYDATGLAANDSFDFRQSGWYAQAVYQFMPAWRVGLRYDRLDGGSVNAASNAANLVLPGYAPTRATVMLDWSPSEFSRIRLQYANDRARYGLTDNQFTVQYQMSLGSHGAHDY
ncbi:MAG TPA: hypothetical protein PKC97_16350 [Burkholderiaceae bacterium]|mgnify:CR=1 FL=1|nr:hypothetical protein [Burkholderiaceae bacterium]